MVKLRLAGGRVTRTVALCDVHYYIGPNTLSEIIYLLSRKLLSSHKYGWLWLSSTSCWTCFTENISSRLKRFYFMTYSVHFRTTTSLARDTHSNMACLRPTCSVGGVTWSCRYEPDIKSIFVGFFSLRSSTRTYLGMRCLPTLVWVGPRSRCAGRKSCWYSADVTHSFHTCMYHYFFSGWFWLSATWGSVGSYRQPRCCYFLWISVISVGFIPLIRASFSWVFTIDCQR